MIVLHGFLPSGNVYKIRLLFAHLGIEHRRIEVAQYAGHTSLPAFRRINRQGSSREIRRRPRSHRERRNNAYTHVADEGGFDLSPYSHVRRWLDEVRAQPGHIRLLHETSALPVTTLDEEPIT